MINTEDFVNRLQKIIEYYGESASSFAEKIGVQRSSISHILSGRNKPSLEFVLKILNAFPDVELYWLLIGKGDFPTLKNEPVDINKEITPEEKNVVKKEVSNQPTELFNEEIINTENESTKKIERIIIFFSDGSFKNYQN